jgi:hypothetical protein
MAKYWQLRCTRDTFNLIDIRTGRAVCWGGIDGTGFVRGIDMPDDIRKSNPSRLAVLRAIGGQDKDGIFLRASAYYRDELAAAKELGTVAFVEDMQPWAANALLRRHFNQSLPVGSMTKDNINAALA